MAEEASRIGVSVDTVQAVNNIRNLAKEIRKTSKDVDLFDKFMNQLNPVLSSIASGFSLDVTAIKELNGTLKSAVTGINELNGSINSLARGGGKLYSSLNKTAQPLREMLKTTNDMAKQANRFNFGNINAQLQDIIVTSQMGMRPLSIGLQQGTQLVYILQQSKAPLADFVAGLKSLISPLSLSVVGITALVAKGIQMVNWTEVGKKSLNGLADAFDWLAKNVENFSKITLKVLSAVGVALLAFSAGSFITALPSLLTGIFTSLTSIWKVVVAITPILFKLVGLFLKFVGMGTVIATLETAMWLLCNPITAVATAVGVAIGAFILFGDTVKDVCNQAIGRIAVVGNSLSSLPRIIGGGFGRGIMNLFSRKSEGNSFQAEWNDVINENVELLEKDYIGALTGVVEELDKNIGFSEKLNTVNVKIGETFTKVSEGIKNYAKGLGESDKDAKKLQKTIEGLRKEYEELAISYRNKIDDIAFEKSTRGMTEEQKLVAQINHEYDQEIAKLERKVALKQIDVGLFAKEKGELDRLKQGYIESALEQEKYNESVKNFNSVMDYSSSVTKGFFSDLKKGLKDGESAWESFTNAVVNMLDKIQDKMMDLAVDAMFDSFKQSNKTGSGNWLSGIVNAGISFFTGGNNSGIIGTSSYNPATTPPSVKPTLMAANGGVFSNGIYSSPTVFKFARGDKFGVMGEAGPEAVMPLRRGPDGSLGVKADGIGGSNVVVNVINNSNAQARTEQRQTAQGMEIDVMIDEMVGEKLARPGTSSNSALRAYNNRQLITR